MSFRKQDGCISIQEIVTRNTGIPSEEFLKTSGEPYIHNLEQAVHLLLQHKDEPIQIIGDYDTDGICATAIMENGLRRAGIHAQTRLPRRFSEGYGLSVKIINEIESGVVITVDNGIAAREAIRVAKEKGLVVIVTDHHLSVEDEDGKLMLPEADVIVDPAAEKESGFHNYCGAAIAYRFVKELFRQCQVEADLSSLIVLASIATVADVMPLIGPNRQLVAEGLKLINSGKGVTGLRILLEKLKMKGHLTEDDYGFKLGPIFNASGRLYDDGAERTLDLLKAKPTDVKIGWKADELILNNEKRKKVFKESLFIADEQLDKKAIRKRTPIVIYHPEFGEGIIGLIAGEYCERYKLPVVVFTKTKSGVLKGSGRSTEEVHLKQALDRIQDKILGYGGHAGAAGLSIREEDLEEFRKAFIESCGKLKPLPKDVFYDLELDLSRLEETTAEVNRFAPYGEGNPPIRFHLKGFAVDSYREIADGTGFMAKGRGLTLMGFDMAKKYAKLDYPKHIDAVGVLKENWFNNKRSFKLELVEIDASH